MNNMKKLLALVLALVMTMGLATVGANAALVDEGTGDVENLVVSGTTMLSGTATYKTITVKSGGTLSFNGSAAKVTTDSFTAEAGSNVGFTGTSAAALTVNQTATIETTEFGGVGNAEGAFTTAAGATVTVTDAAADAVKTVADSTTDAKIQTVAATSYALTVTSATSGVTATADKAVVSATEATSVTITVTGTLEKDGKIAVSGGATASQTLTADASSATLTVSVPKASAAVALTVAYTAPTATGGTNSIKVIYKGVTFENWDGTGDTLTEDRVYVNNSDVADLAKAVSETGDITLTKSKAFTAGNNVAFKVTVANTYTLETFSIVLNGTDVTENTDIVTVGTHGTGKTYVIDTTKAKTGDIVITAKASKNATYNLKFNEALFTDPDDITVYVDAGDVAASSFAWDDDTAVALAKIKGGAATSTDYGYSFASVDANGTWTLKVTAGANVGLNAHGITGLTDDATVAITDSVNGIADGTDKAVFTMPKADVTITSLPGAASKVYTVKYDADRITLSYSDSFKSSYVKSDADGVLQLKAANDATLTAGITVTVKDGGNWMNFSSAEKTAGYISGAVMSPTAGTNYVASGKTLGDLTAIRSNVAGDINLVEVTQLKFPTDEILTIGTTDVGGGTNTYMVAVDTKVVVKTLKAGTGLSPVGATNTGSYATQYVAKDSITLTKDNLELVSTVKLARNGLTVTYGTTAVTGDYVMAGTAIDTTPGSGANYHVDIDEKGTYVINSDTTALEVVTTTGSKNINLNAAVAIHKNGKWTSESFPTIGANYSSNGGYVYAKSGMALVFKAAAGTAYFGEDAISEANQAKCTVTTPWSLNELSLTLGVENIEVVATPVSGG